MRASDEPRGGLSVDLVAIIAQVMLHQLASPFLFVPAIAVGWFARTRGQVLAGALAIGAVAIALGFLEPLPEGAQRVHALLPLVFVSPLAWAFATAALKPSLRRGDPRAPASSALKAVRALVGAAIGAPVGGGLGALVGSLAADYYSISTFEGGAGYFVIFLFVLPGILIGALAGAIILRRR